MSDCEDQLTDEEKATIVQDFITHAPPGEVDDVIRDVRILLNDDQNFKESIVQALSRYQQTQFLPVKASQNQVLLTPHGYLDNGRYVDPSTKKTFKYDFSKKTCVDVEDGAGEDASEVWRAALESTINEYLKEHYPAGVATVYGKCEGSDVLLTACIEDHKYSPENFWNGKWRSEWKVSIAGEKASIVGVLKTQVRSLIC